MPVNREEKTLRLESEEYLLLKHAFSTFLNGHSEGDHKQIAQRLGMPHSNLLRLLRGDVFPRTRTVEKIADRLGLAYAYVADRLVRADGFNRQEKRWRFVVGPEIEKRERQELLSTDDVGAVLKISRAEVSTLCRSGALQALRVGKLWKISQSAALGIRSSSYLVLRRGAE